MFTVNVVIVVLIVSLLSAYLIWQQRRDRLRMPWVTLALFVVTVVPSAFAIYDDAVLDALRRDGSALAAGEWWRLVSPLVAQDAGLAGLLFNLAALALLGAAVEVLFGWRMLLVAYLLSGILGEVAAYAVLPQQGFAGNSVAVLGLAGVLCVRQIVSGTPAWFIGAIGVVAALALVIWLDIHGVGFLVGAVVGLVWWWVAQRRVRRPVRSTVKS